MLPWGKQKHLSSAQPWLSLSDKSWGGLCQRCPACHLSPPPPPHSYAVSPTQPLHIHTLHPVCTRPPSSWQCDRSRWFTPLLPSGLLCSRPRLAHLCREREGLSPTAKANGEIPAPGYSAVVVGNSKRLQHSFPLIPKSFPLTRHDVCRSDELSFTNLNKKHAQESLEDVS